MTSHRTPNLESQILNKLCRLVAAIQTVRLDVFLDGSRRPKANAQVTSNSTANVRAAQLNLWHFYLEALNLVEPFRGNEFSQDTIVHRFAAGSSSTVGIAS